MTRIKKNVTRITDAKQWDVGQYKPIVVTIKPKVLTFRLKGRKASYDLPVDRCYFLAVLADVERKRYLKKRNKG